MIIGIDLGTTNSLVAVWADGKAVVIPNALGQALTPSCVSLMEDGTLAVGEAARERLQTHAGHSAAVFKRYMGTNRNIRLGARAFRPEELSSFVLRALKADAEAYLGHPVEQAIITVPAYFSDAQRKATRNAAELAGLTVACLVNEPTAAALAYGVQNSGESKFLVFDLGGGTFDISVLELFDGVMEVRASTGDNFLGGEDFTSLLADAFYQNSGLGKTTGGKRERLAPALEQRLRAVAEQAKRALGELDSASMSLLSDGVIHTWDCTQEQYLALCEPLLARLRQPIERALRDARIMPAELDSIILAGGATRMPMVRRLVGRMFGRFPVVELNPDELIAMGAAVQAGLKMRDAALQEVVMTDVAPYTLGIEVGKRIGPNEYVSGCFLPIIDRNSVVPISRVKQVSPIDDHQDVLYLRVFQGESAMVEDNIFLGELKIPVPPLPAGQVNVDVRFTYDVNGLLEATARVLNTGAEHVLVIEENPGLLSPAEIAERLAGLQALKIHPREQTRNRTTLARADRVYQEMLGRDRDVVGQALAVFRAALESQDTQRIAAVQKKLDELLDQAETRPQLLPD